MLLIYFTIIISQFILAYFQIFNNPNILSLITDLLFVFIPLLVIHTFPKARIHVYGYAGLTFFLGILMFVFVLYSRFYNEIATYHSLSLIGELGVVKDSASNLLKWYDGFFFLNVLLFPLVLHFHIKKKRSFKTFLIPPRYTSASVAVLVLALSFFTIDMMNKNIISDSKRAEKMGVFTYNIATALSGTIDVHAADVTAANIHRIKGTRIIEQPKYFGAAKDKNLIIIQLESFQRNLTGVKINGQSVTPTLDQLEKETLYSNKFFQTVSKSNTADAEWSVYTSTFPSGYYTNTQTYSDRIIPSLPRLLGKNGYTSNTFHTNDAAFYNRDKFYPAVGFDKYYDKSFFGEQDIIGFSASDEVLYKKTLPVMLNHQKKNQKFYSQLISVTSHMPFQIPKEKQELALPENLKNTELGDYFQSVRYADTELGKFIEKLKKTGLWDESVVVIYGDHHIINTTKLAEKEKKYVNRSTELKAHPADDYRIPFYIHYPNMKKTGEIKNIGGEIDIMPTILNLLGIKTDKQIMFGEDILNTKINFVPQRYSMPEGSFFTNHYMYAPDESFKTGKATNYDGSSQDLTNEVKKKFEASQKLLQYSDSYVDNLPKQEIKQKETAEN